MGRIVVVEVTRSIAIGREDAEAVRGCEYPIDTKQVSFYS